MVFPKVIEPFNDGKPSFSMTGISNKQVVGDMMLQSQMVGMINALAGLADYTNQVFSSILKESAGISSRIAAIGERCSTLTQIVEETENVMKTSLEAKTTNPRAEFHATVPESVQLFTPATAPPSLRQQYEQCRPPPNLSLLDAFVEGQSCMKSYTDPGFFVEQWMESQARLREEVRQHRAARRAAREAKRILEEEEEERETNGGNNVRQMHRPVRMRTFRYDVHTGEKELHSTGKDKDHGGNHRPPASTRHMKMNVNNLRAPPPPPNRVLMRPKLVAPLRDTELPKRAAPDAVYKSQESFYNPSINNNNTPAPVLPALVSAAKVLPTTTSATPVLPAPVLDTPVFVAPVSDLNRTREILAPPLPSRPPANATLIAKKPSARGQFLSEIEQGFTLRPIPPADPILRDPHPSSFFPFPPFPSFPSPLTYSDSDDSDWDTWSDDAPGSIYHA